MDRKQILISQLSDNFEVLKYSIKTNNTITQGFIQGIILGALGYALRCDDITLDEYKTYQKQMEIILLGGSK